MVKTFLTFEAQAGANRRPGELVSEGSNCELVRERARWSQLTPREFGHRAENGG